MFLSLVLMLFLAMSIGRIEHPAFSLEMLLVLYYCRYKFCSKDGIQQQLFANKIPTYVICHILLLTFISCETSGVA